MTEQELSKEIDKLEERIDEFTKKLDKEIQTASLINRILATTVGVLYLMIFFCTIQISCQVFPQMKSLHICVVK